MRIGIEAQRIFRPKRFGMDIVAIELINHLQEIDADNEYFIFVRPDDNRKGINLYRKNFSLVEFDARSYVDWEQILLPKFARKFNLDVLHCTNNTAPLFCNTPLLLTLHDTIFLDKIEIFDSSIPRYQSWGNLYRKMLVPKIIRKVEHIITVSDFERNRMIDKFPLAAKKFKRIYNGVADYFFEPINQQNAELFLRKHNINAPYILFLGNLHPRKNLFGVLKAFELLDNQCFGNIKLLITNLSKEDYSAAKANANVKINDDDVILTNYIGREELPYLFAQSSMLLYPSIREGFGIPILEAFATGVPVITSNTSSMPEVAGEAALLVNPHNPDEITDAIIRILSDNKLKNDLITKAKQRAKLFTWKDVASQYLNVYKNYQ